MSGNTEEKVHYGVVTGKWWPQTGSCHDANFVVIGGTRACQNGNLGATNNDKVGMMNILSKPKNLVTWVILGQKLVSNGGYIAACLTNSIIHEIIIP